jgi:hypothetical protein
MRRHSLRVRPAVAAAVVLSAATAFGAGCTQAQLAGDSPAYLIISSLEGASGADDTSFSNTLSSDVVTNGGILEDPGRVSFALALKDPGGAESPTQPSTANFITINRYRVRYVRTDGRSTPGVDVPYPFDGAITLTVDGGGAAGTLILVRVQAKLEQPLLALRNLGGAVALSTLAEVTFYGRDQAGRDVSVTGHISVNFADWADPD